LGLTGRIVNVALDEDGLARYAKLSSEVQSLDGLVASGTIPAAILETCKISAYIISTIVNIAMFLYMHQ